MIVQVHQVGGTVDVDPERGSNGESPQGMPETDPELEQFKDGGCLLSSSVLLHLEETRAGTKHWDDWESGWSTRGGEEEACGSVVRVQLQTRTEAPLVRIIEKRPIVSFSGAEAAKALRVDVEVCRQQGEGGFVLEEGDNGLERTEGTTGPVRRGHGFD
jgi:hypothetical protein